jgi:riboflavin kinase/FMN adenylyltransferase
VAVLGVFDGVHLGHRRILKAAVLKAHKIKGISVAVTFWPHPQAKESLCSLEHRLRLIKEIGIDLCVVINFNKGFASLRAEDFVKNILFLKLRASYVYVGRNFKFGRGAKGDYRTLEKLSCLYDFKLRLFDVIKINNRPVSSTYIRSLVKQGRLSLAKRLLGRRVSVLGTVIHGASLAKELGFPTANIDLDHEVAPASGVYAVGVILGLGKLSGVCYIGTKPTLLETQKIKYVEVHIFDFCRDIYGEHLEIQFIRKIRSEKKFASLTGLVKRANQDIQIAKRLFSRH